MCKSLSINLNPCFYIIKEQNPVLNIPNKRIDIHNKITLGYLKQIIIDKAKETEGIPTGFKLQISDKMIRSFIDNCAGISVSDKPFLNDSKMITICGNTFIGVNKKVSMWQVYMEFMGFNWIINKIRGGYDDYCKNIPEGCKSDCMECISQNVFKNKCDVIVSIMCLKHIYCAILIFQIWHLFGETQETKLKFGHLTQYDIILETEELKTVKLPPEDTLKTFDKYLKYIESWKKMPSSFKYP
jgi:hypothetical protein